MTYEQWVAYGDRLSRTVEGVMWWVVDWWRFGMWWVVDWWRFGMWWVVDWWRFGSHRYGDR